MNYEIIQGKWMPSREDREYKEEILEGVDEAVSTLERMISEERVEELLSTLTDLQRKVVHIHLFHADWSKEYAELKSLLPADEYSEARASTLNAFYTSPTVIKAMYGCVNNVPKKPRVIDGRVSVLDRLHIKQAERARKDNAQVQQQERTRKN